MNTANIGEAPPTNKKTAEEFLRQFGDLASRPITLRPQLAMGLHFRLD